MRHGSRIPPRILTDHGSSQRTSTSTSLNEFILQFNGMVYFRRGSSRFTVYRLVVLRHPNGILRPALRSPAAPLLSEDVVRFLRQGTAPAHLREATTSSKNSTKRFQQRCHHLPEAVSATMASARAAPYNSPSRAPPGRIIYVTKVRTSTSPGPHLTRAASSTYDVLTSRR